jgi:hypothetical protein
VYSEKVTLKHLTTASRSLGRQLKRSSSKEIAIYCAHLNSLLNEDKQLKRPLTKDETEWIQNEQIVCTIDFPYWAANYARIKGKDGQVIPFIPNLAQRIMLAIWGEAEELEHAIMVQVLKARQLGISTLSEMAIAHRTMFHSNVDAVVASSDPDKSRRMSNMMLFCWDRQPWWLMPARTKYKAGELVEFGGLNSAVSIQWGNQTTGIARGSTPTIAHLSELADFENPKELVDASLLRAMHENPFTLLVLESTANGRDNWWHDKWNFAKNYWSKGVSRLRPVFLPWYVGTDLYPNENWLKMHPAPEKYDPPEDIKDHAIRAEAYVRANPLLSRYLGEQWTMPAEQKWFYEANRLEYKSNNDLNKWYQEMPADDLEAFQHKTSSIFDAEFQYELRNACKPPLVVLGLQGPEEEIPLRLQPSAREIDHNSPFKPMVISPSAVAEKATSSYRLVPLKWTGHDMSPLGKIFLYELPEKFNDYGVGVDTAFGVGQDRTVVQIVRKATPYANAEQCAELATDQAGAFEVWPFVLALSTLYSVVPSGGGDKRQAKVVIEMAANGEATQRELFKRGWHHFHLQQKAQTRGFVLTNQTTPLFGWKTTEASRGPMLDFLRKALVDGWLSINSPWFVDEMGNFIRNEKKERLEAAEGAKDDRLMAMGIVLDSLHRMDTYRAATPSWQARLASEASAKTHPVFSYDYNIAPGEPLDIMNQLNDYVSPDEMLEEYS